MTEPNPLLDAPEEAAPPAPLLVLRDGLPPVIDSPAALERAAADLASGTGPVAIDAERASGYRYSQRAYLIQLRRAGAGTMLIDPIAVPDLVPVTATLRDTEWILHAASQDLACLAGVGLVPQALFDTELAGRLLGYPRVGLATLVEELLGQRLRKEHSAVDWSTRPLPTPWLEYAALDVEVLIELRAALAEELVQTGKADWAAQEFAALVGFQPASRPEPWRRTSGGHRVRGRRGLAVVRELWLTRDRIAAERDVAPGRLIPDSAIVAVAAAMPTGREEMLAVPGFHGRGARRYAPLWWAAIEQAVALPEDQLPERAPRLEGPPHPRSWPERDPVAAARLASARAALTTLAGSLTVPVENLVSPDVVRRILWQPPPVEQVPARLADLGARDWQIAQIGPVIEAALTEFPDP